MKKRKIVVYVDGGNVQAIYTNDESFEHVEVVLVDFDNLVAEGKTQIERKTILENAKKGMTEVF